MLKNSKNTGKIKIYDKFNNIAVFKINYLIISKLRFMVIIFKSSKLKNNKKKTKKINPLLLFEYQ